MLNLKIDDWCRAITFSSEYICMRGWDIDLSVVLKDGIQDLRPKISHWYPPTSEPVKQPTTKIEAGKINNKLHERKKSNLITALCNLLTKPGSLFCSHCERVPWVLLQLRGNFGSSAGRQAIIHHKVFVLVVEKVFEIYIGDSHEAPAESRKQRAEHNVHKLPDIMRLLGSKAPGKGFHSFQLWSDGIWLPEPIFCQAS